MPKPRINLPYAVLIGLTPLLPLPFVDDWIAGLLLRRMVSELGLAYGIKLTPPEIDRLTTGEASGCLGGCLSSLLLYPLLKRVLREVFFILEWQRAINFVSQSYYYAFLLDTAFENGWYTPGSMARAAQVNAAILRVRKTANTNLVRRVVEFHFNNSRNAVFGTARWLFTEIRKISFQRALQRLRSFRIGIGRRKPGKNQAPPEKVAAAENVASPPGEHPPRAPTGEAAGAPAAPPPTPPAPKAGLRAWFTRRRSQDKPPPGSSPPPKPPPRKNRPLDEVLRKEFLWLRVGELAGKIQADLTRLPRQHFDELKQRLANELAPVSPPPFYEGDTIPNRSNQQQS